MPGFIEFIKQVGEEIKCEACRVFYLFFSNKFNIPREKSLAINFEDSQFRRNRTFNFIVSKIYVDKRS